MYKVEIRVQAKGKKEKKEKIEKAIFHQVLLLSWV